MRPPSEIRPRTNRRLPIMLAVIGIVFLLLLSSIPAIAGFFTDYLWFGSVGFTKTWRGLIIARVLPVIVFTLFAFIVIWINLLIADRLAPTFQSSSPEDQAVERFQQATGRFSGRIRFGVAVLLGIFSGASVANNWKQWILFTHASKFGTKDPQFHKDIGFYVFQLPALEYVVKWLFGLLLITLIVVAIAHYLNGGIRLAPPVRRITSHVKAHLSVLLGLMALVKAVDYYFARFELVFSRRGAVEGATYTDIKAELPALRLLILIAVVAAVLFLVNIWRRGWALPVIAVGLWALVSVVVGTLYPLYVQRFQVRPNELAREKPYIKRNIDATRTAFGLNNLQVKPFNYQENLNDQSLQANEATLQNARLWDPAALQGSFNALQAFRPFYQFGEVDVDRYKINGQIQQVLLATRNLNSSKIPNPTWVNKFLVYTHGYGAAAAAGNQVASDDSPSFLLSDIPPQGKLDISKQPGIYFGEGFSGYSIVDSGQKEFQPGSTDQNANATTEYKGTGGVKTSSRLRRLALAIHFGDLNPLISKQVTSHSRALYIRDVGERVRKAAPFLQFDHDPYPVVLNGRMIWVVDGYTSTTEYPYSEGHAPNDQVAGSELGGDVNYVRNSVKATVDAYDGTIRFYVMDKKDPILHTYRKAFPQLFTDLSKAPKGLVDHLRYPEDIFRLQTQVLDEYHVTDPSVFYSGDQDWSVAADPNETSDASVVSVGQQSGSQGQAARLTDTGARVPPQYLLLGLPGDTEQQFLLTRSFSPKSTNNLMSAFIVARSDPAHYGQLITYDMSAAAGANNKAALPPSPTQIDSQTNSTVEISSQFTLLRQQGSQLLAGGIQVIPINNSFIYVQPFYVQGSGSSSFPRFRFAVVSYGARSALGNSVPDALSKLFSGVTLTPGNGSSGSTSATTTTTSPLTGNATVDQLLKQAGDAFAAANQDLKNGDLAGYQQQVQQAQSLVQQAQQLSSGSTSTTKPSKET